MRGRTSIDPSVLRGARLRAGLTQHELAHLIGVAGGERVSRWELGTSTPRPNMMIRLAKTLNVTPAQLLGADADSADLQDLRLMAGLSARTLAASANVSTASYVRWEAGRGKRLPSEATLNALASSLNVSAEELHAAFARTRRAAS